jgi:hypothetical protein
MSAEITQDTPETKALEALRTWRDLCRANDRIVRQIVEAERMRASDHVSSLCVSQRIAQLRASLYAVNADRLGAEIEMLAAAGQIGDES